jgi:hypothetical protein
MAGVEAILEDFNRLKSNCEKLAGQKILVGIVGGADSEVLIVAHAHEYGVPGKLPERSYLRASFDSDQDELTQIVSTQVSKVLSGDTSAEAAANSIGAQAAQLVQGYIDENRVTPPSDYSKKRVEVTLYETGTHIRDRISWKVEGA